MTVHGTRPNYVAVWAWLIGLFVLGLGASFLPGSRKLAVALVFSTAAAKAALVGLNFMHLRAESKLVYAIALVPVLVVLVLLFALFPDFVHHR